MKIVIKKNNATVLNFAFILWLFSEIMFEYSTFSRIALMLFVGLVVLVTRKPRWSYALTWYGLFVLWSAINIWTGHAIDKNVAIKATQTIFLNLIFLWALVNYCEYIGSIETVLGIFKWVIFIICIPCFFGGLSAVLSGGRLTILNINSNAIAMMAAFAVIVFIHGCTGRRRDGKWYTEICVIAFLILTILMTGSRKGLIIPIVGVYIMACFRKPGKFVVNTLVIALLAFVVLYALLNVPFLYDLVGYRVEPVLQYMQNEDFDEASLASRLDYIELAWKESFNSPIWGHGLDCFRMLREAYGTYSHCNYVELLFSLGWTGAIIFYFPYLQGLLYTPYAFKRKKDHVALAVALMVPFLICNYFAVTYNVRSYIFIPTICMLILRRGRPNSEAEQVF